MKTRNLGLWKLKFFAAMLVMTLLLGTCLTGCGSSTESSFDYSAYGVVVGQVDGIDDDYILGVDISSIIEVENAGGVFYDADGNEADIFELMASYGINYVRIRLWNNPYDEDGNSFGGGGNDLATDLEIAKRAVAAGMLICMFFHYSDFLAYPSKQRVPREWADYSYEELRQVIYEYTYEVLKQFEEAGCLPSMVQTGNEINNGMLWPNGSSATWQAVYFAAAASAVKEVSADIKTVLHLANGASYSVISGVLDQYITLGVDFDVIGLSYYSYWHGSIAEFQDCVEQLNANYEQEICVMEYSYAYGDDSNAYTANIFSSENDEASGGYKATVQGQASYIHDVNEVIASVSHGIGTFYWEPAWLAIEGTAWASTYANSYLTAQGDGGGEGTVSWANQALFDLNGNVLDSLNAFLLMKSSGTADENILEITDTITCNVDLSQSEVRLPETTTAFTDLDRWVELDITWNSEEVSAITQAGTYTVTGTVSCGGSDYTITATVTGYYDYLKNGSFDDDTVSGDVTDFSKVSDWDMTGTSGSFRVESKNARTGKANLNIWCSSDYENTLSQTIYNLTEGTYTLSVYARSAMENYLYPECTLYVTVGGETYETEITWGSTWSDWVETTLTFTVTGTQDAVIGISSTGAGGTWAHFDDFGLARVSE